MNEDYYAIGDTFVVQRIFRTELVGKNKNFPIRKMLLINRESGAVLCVQAVGDDNVNKFNVLTRNETYYFDLGLRTAEWNGKYFTNIDYVRHIKVDFDPPKNEPIPEYLENEEIPF